MDLKKEEDKKNLKKVKKGLMTKCTNAINRFLENSFAKCGLFVGTHPVKTILISLTFAFVCLAGLIEFQQENRGEKLWVKQSSKYTKDQDWTRAKFPIRVRYIGLIVKSGDLLTKEGLQILIQLDDMVKNVYSNTPDKNWNEIKFDTPILSLLELWDFNRTVIEKLTKDDILKVINSNQLISLTRNHNVSMSKYISDIHGNSTHPVVTAGVARLQYYINFRTVFDKAAGRWVDDRGADWEIEFGKSVKRQSIPGVELLYSTWESYRQAGLDAVGNDYGLLFSGYALIITYVAFMLGKFSSHQQKIWLAIVGIICVALSIAVAMGLCSAAQVFYGPVHSVLPFLMLGIGVDDVFVIVQTWDNVAGSIHDDEPIPQKVSRTMRHAGVAITVTSFTDVCAFLIGASTVLPALRSFCIYVGVGIFMLYVYASTFFVAFLTIDAQRQRNNREACLCIKLPSSWAPLACSKKNYLQSALSYFAKAIVSIPGKIIVVILTATLLGFGGYGLSQLNQNVDPDWFLPRDSDELQYRVNFRKYFPSHGVQVAAYVGDVDYFAEQNQLHNLYHNIVNDYSIKPDTVSSWYEHFITYVAQDPTKNVYLQNKIISDKEKFYSFLKQFLDSSGKGYKSNLNYIGNNITVIDIKASRITMTHKNIPETKKQLKSMDSARQAASSVVFSTGIPNKAFVFGDEYIRWQTNRIIGEELTRNLILAGVCVFLVTLFLIANLWTSFLVLLCVVFSLVNICGYMYFWDLSIDMIISTILVVALGFAVDYSGHIGHAFMAARKGSRNDRAVTAITQIGPAVLNGGISTFLAFCLLAGSESYAFQTFFKVFFLVVSIGLFHGMVFLPVLLSIVGPRAYVTTEEEVTTTECKSKIEDISVKSPTTTDVESEVDCKQKDIEVLQVEGVDNLTFVVS